MISFSVKSGCKFGITYFNGGIVTYWVVLSNLLYNTNTSHREGIKD